MARSRTSSGKSGPVSLSIVVPVYNEAGVLELFFQRTLAVLETLKLSFEIICIDDGSADDSFEIVRRMHEKDPRIKCLALSRNFGKDVALSAGLDYARGEMIVPTDVDLQDPPELIPAMIEKLKEGYDVVYMQRSARLGESWFKKFSAKMFYRVLSALSDIEIPRDVGDFRIFNRRVLNALADLRERRRFMKGLFTWVGFRQTSMSFTREMRASGNTRWNYWKLWNFAIEGITSFTIGPLRIWTYVGLGLAFLSFLYASFLILRVAFLGIEVPGYASLMVVILFLGAIQLVTLGVLGEYVGRIFQEVKGRPLYIVRDLYGEFRPADRSRAN